MQEPGGRAVWPRVGFAHRVARPALPSIYAPARAEATCSASRIDAMQHRFAFLKILKYRKRQLRAIVC